MKKARLSAVDVLNWDYLREIGDYYDPSGVSDPSAGIRAFAYSFVSTSSEEIRDTMLANILLPPTRWASKEANEEYVVWLARALKSDLELLRRFAKQVGVRLLRD